jgi:hypothetical protein
MLFLTFQTLVVVLADLQEDGGPGRGCQRHLSAGKPRWKKGIEVGPVFLGLGFIRWAFSGLKFFLNKSGLSRTRDLLHK